MKYSRQIAVASAFATSLYSTFACSAVSTDYTGDRLQRCLDRADSASTAGQTDCEAAAYKAYDRRMNSAYAELMLELPHAAAEKLRDAQREWLRFRNIETEANSTFFSTRQGTMYAPMQAAAETAIVRDRAIALETRLRILQIED